jgi:hypothetical protein
MSDPTPKPPLDRGRIKRVAAGVRQRVSENADRSARIGHYRGADGNEHEVVIVLTEADDWEVRDRCGDQAVTVENLEEALEDAVAVAVEYRRDHETRSARQRALSTAQDVNRVRVAMAAALDGQSARDAA